MDSRRAVAAPVRPRLPRRPSPAAASFLAGRAGLRPRCGRALGWRRGPALHGAGRRRRPRARGPRRRVPGRATGRATGRGAARPAAARARRAPGPARPPWPPRRGSRDHAPAGGARPKQSPYARQSSRSRSSSPGRRTSASARHTAAARSGPTRRSRARAQSPSAREPAGAAAAGAGVGSASAWRGQASPQDGTLTRQGLPEQARRPQAGA